MVTPADISAINDRLDGLAARITAASDSQCSATNPHADQLVFLRTGQGMGHYQCRCGMVYEKDGRGGLRDI